VWFGFATGTQPTFVPYGSNNPYIDLVGGEVQLMFDGLPVATSNIQAGKLKLLAITGKKRHATFPDTATFEELGIKDYSPVAWQGLVAQQREMAVGHQQHRRLGAVVEDARRGAARREGEREGKDEDAEAGSAGDRCRPFIRRRQRT
jgi:tripartite-type tricarboxylate transporter receptor subunit TctC